jgi:hypothetical protein
MVYKVLDCDHSLGRMQYNLDSRDSHLNDCPLIPIIVKNCRKKLHYTKFTLYKMGRPGFLPSQE